MSEYAEKAATECYKVPTCDSAQYTKQDERIDYMADIIDAKFAPVFKERDDLKVLLTDLIRKVRAWRDCKNVERLPHLHGQMNIVLATAEKLLEKDDENRI